MAYWLLKTEPTDFSWDDLVRLGREPWNGVRNPTALKHMRAVAPGDEAFIYHTGGQREIVGVARVLTGPYPDLVNPKLVMFDVVPGYRLGRPVTLAEVKAEPALAGWDLVRLARLSVMPVTQEQWEWVHRAALSDRTPLR